MSKYEGFSSDELLRRARVLREIAEHEVPKERRRFERIALEHEDAARACREDRRQGHPEMAYDTAPKVLPTLSLDSELQSLASESLDRWALRVACFTGYDDKPQSDESLHIKAKQIVRAAKALCHYSNGGSPINSCCATKYRCRSAATVAAIVRFGDGSPI